MILDIGCGENPVGSVNIDANKTRKRRIRNFIQASIYHLPFPDNSFYTVYCRAVLEHLENPTKAFKEIIRVAKYEALIIIPHRYFRKHPKGHIQFFGTLQVKEWIFKMLGHYPIITIIYRSFPSECLPIFRIPSLLELKISKTNNNHNFL